MFKVKEQRCGQFGEPIGVHTNLGWCIFGADYKSDSRPDNVCATTSMKKEDPLLDDLGARILRILEKDFSDLAEPQQAAPSRDDYGALEVLERTCAKVGSHYQMALPWKDKETKLPDNRAMAEKRLKTLKRKLESNEELCKKYCEKIREYTDLGYASLAPARALAGRVWYCLLYTSPSPRDA